MPDITLRKITERGYTRGLAATGERTFWVALRPDGTRITTGQTRRAAEANAREVLALAALHREPCECNGGPDCDCPDCDHADCAYNAS